MIFIYKISLGMNSSMFVNCLVFCDVRYVQSSVLGQNVMFGSVWSSVLLLCDQTNLGTNSLMFMNCSVFCDVRHVGSLILGQNVMFGKFNVRTINVWCVQSLVFWCSFQDYWLGIALFFSILTHYAGVSPSIAACNFFFILFLGTPSQKNFFWISLCRKSN